MDKDWSETFRGLLSLAGARYVHILAVALPVWGVLLVGRNIVAAACCETNQLSVATEIVPNWICLLVAIGPVLLGNLYFGSSLLATEMHEQIVALEKLTGHLSAAQRRQVFLVAASSLAAKVGTGTGGGAVSTEAKEYAEAVQPTVPS